MRYDRFSPALAAVILWTTACGTPHLGPESPLELNFPLVEKARLSCRTPLLPGITAGPGGIVLLETRTGYLQALDPEKMKILWTSSVGAGGPVPVVVGDRIVCASTGGRVVGLDPGGGTVWNMKADGPVRDDLRVVDGRIVVHSEKGTLIALNPTDGTVAWKINVPERADMTSDGSRIVLRTTDNRLSVFRSDGSSAGDFFIGGRAAGDFGLAGDCAVIGFADGYLGAYSLTTGKSRWRQRLGGVPLGPPISDGRNVYVVLSNQILAAFHLKRGEILYWKPLSGRGAFAPRLVETYVFVSSRSPRLQAFRAKDGQVKTAFEAPGEILAPPERIGSNIFLAVAGETEKEDLFVSLSPPPPTDESSPEKKETGNDPKEPAEIKK